MTATPSPSGKRKGPSRSLSKTVLIEATLQMLEEAPVADFSMPRLAKRVGVGVMTLYTYYSGRDALLDDVAEEVFRRWQPPEPGDRWQDFVMEWQRRLLAHFLRYPIALKVIAWDEHMSPSWWAIWAPVLHLLEQLGLKGERLAFAVDWFSFAVIGMIQARVNGVRGDAPFPRMTDENIPAADRPALRALRRHAAGQRDAAIEFGFARIVEGIESLVQAT